MAVSMMPGQMALTRMPRGVSSAASASDRPDHPELRRHVRRHLARPARARPSTRCSRCARAGPGRAAAARTQCTPYTVPIRLILSTRSQSSSCRVVHAARVTHAGVVVEHVHGAVLGEHAPPPAPRRRPRRRSPPCARGRRRPAPGSPRERDSARAPSRSTTCTLAPRRANRSAVERPIPEPAPVITTTLPLKSRSTGGSLRA